MSFFPPHILGQIAAFDAIRTIDSATFTGSFQAVGTPLTVVPRIILFQNDSGVTVQVTDSTVTGAAMTLPAGERVIIDCATNRDAKDQLLGFPIGTQFYASGTSSTGNLTITIIYGKQ